MADRETNESQRGDLLTGNRIPDERLLVLKTSSKPMLVVFSQLDLVTSGTSLGSAKVMSAHCASHSSVMIVHRSRAVPYIVQSSPMLCRLNHLDGSIIANHSMEILWQGNLR